MLTSILNSLVGEPLPGVDVPHVRTEPAGVDVTLRLLDRRDAKRWSDYRIADQHLLQPVEPTAPVEWEFANSQDAFPEANRGLMRLARDGVIVPCAIEADGHFAGQLTIGNIQHGSVSSAWIGYWVYSELQGKGVATAAVALGVDYAMQTLKLHRVEATVMESNTSSRRVLEKTGFREEGRLLRNLHINGEWTDHLLVAQTAEEVPARGRVRQLEAAGILSVAVNR